MALPHLCLHDQGDHPGEKHGNHRQSRDHDPEGYLQCRVRRIEEQKGSQDQGNDAADGQNAVAHDLHLRDEQDNREQDQEHARIIDRQGLHGEKGKDQRDAPDHAGKDDAGVRKLEVKSGQAQKEEDICNIGVAERGQHALTDPHFLFPDQRSLCLQYLPALFQGHFAAVDLLQQPIQIRRHKVDNLKP